MSEIAIINDMDELCLDLLKKKKKTKSKTSLDQKELYLKSLDAIYAELNKRKKPKKIIFPQIHIRSEGKKTLWLNFNEMIYCIRRPRIHFCDYLRAELSTTNNFNGDNELVLHGRFKESSIMYTTKKYIIEYVLCGMCKSYDTIIDKGQKICNYCAAHSSVAKINLGYVAQLH